jgi:hypothetical protein
MYITVITYHGGLPSKKSLALLGTWLTTQLHVPKPHTNTDSHLTNHSYYCSFVDSWGQLLPPLEQLALIPEHLQQDRN